MLGMEQERWRAWLGTGDETRLAQVDVAEFPSCAAARAWVEERLVTGTALYGSVDRMPGCAAGLDADVVDGRVRWRRVGCASGEPPRARA